MTTDLTFITNENGQSLKDRFNVLIKDARFFDVLSGYFYTSGFYAIYKSLENTEKIRILVGISTDRKAFELFTNAKQEIQLELMDASHKEAKEVFVQQVAGELENSQDSQPVEKGVAKFIEWIKCAKLEIKVYPSQNIHAKVYIVTFREGDRDVGRVITGSSNLTQSGLVDNLEFNVELKNAADHAFAKAKFEELWADAVDISEKYIETIETRTWLNQDIKPYDLYLKLLYEYFKDELNQSDEVFASYVPENFIKLEYQEQAVLNARKILEEYGGVFISDVVGLGKTYIATLLAGQLDGRTLVIAPPVLLDPDNPGSWRNAFSDFRVAADFESIGKLEDLLERDTDKYKNVIIDEAHRFRNEGNRTYEMLAEICRNKRVILVTATPYNNSPWDILSEIKLFQNSKKSTIPNMPDIEEFFKGLAKNLRELNRQADYEDYLAVVRENSKVIREKVLKYLMVRRTRTEIVNYYGRDMSKQGLRFPEVAAPAPMYYELNEEEDRIFTSTMELLSQGFTYARYTPLLYLKKPLDQLEEQSQRNMGKFMKILLIKRLESSFFAFRNSVRRFIHSYELFLREFENGNVYISKDYTYKILEYLENDEDAAIEDLITKGKAEKYKSTEFKPEYIDLLKNDLAVLRKVQRLWTKIERDPKLLALLKQLSRNKLLKENKLILFTESKETAEYLTSEINKAHKNQALCFSGSSDESTRDVVIRNFDAKAKKQENTYRILVATEVLSEGVNLHRSNVVINYDIPWNPTRMMQRVGRINRVDTKFDTIYTFNFFPTVQANNELGLKEAAQAKIHAFLTLLGGDAALLTEGEPIGSMELFDKLVSRKTITGEDEEETSELKYLTLIKDIRDNDPDLFERIKRLPRKARSSMSLRAQAAKQSPNSEGIASPSGLDTPDEHGLLDQQSMLVTYFRKGKIQKFFAAANELEAKELDFITAAETLECTPDEKKHKLPETYFELLDKNKDAFVLATTEDAIEVKARKGRDTATRVLKILQAVFKNMKQLTEEQEEFVKKVMEQLKEGGLPRQTVKVTYKALNKMGSDVYNPLKVVAVLQTNIPARLLESHYVEENPRSAGKREVILSMYLAGQSGDSHF
ncbi:MAG TPA: helicase-related protein [Anaerolineales bacterium]|nr:helicase-related protein [Anaerolineales bacterium]